MLSKIPSDLLDLYRPLSAWDSFYLRARWRLCPYELVGLLLPKGGKILDLGCGYGLLANLIALKNPDTSVVGIDLKASRIRVARRSAVNRDNVRFLLGAVEEIEMGEYDVVVMTDVLHHLDDAKANTLLKTISSGLSGDGLLAILDVDRRPFWKFCITYAIDRLLNLKNDLFYRSSRGMGGLLEKFSMATERTIQAHKGLPLSDILYLCKRKGP